jgi:hypothetical protein
MNGWWGWGLEGEGAGVEMAWGSPGVVAARSHAKRWPNSFFAGSASMISNCIEAMKRPTVPRSMPSAPFNTHE